MNKSNWINVKDRLPEIDQEVLITDGKDIIMSTYCLSFFDNNEHRFYPYGD